MQNQRGDANAAGEGEVSKGTGYGRNHSGPPKSRVCATCGSDVVTTEWYPVVVRADETGVFQTYPFCGDDCREMWMELGENAERQ